jgi:hypothetical protein
MRTQVTVARLRDIKVHTFRDRDGHKHVTGMTIHGALVIPTRLFWIALAEIACVDDAEFGNEYELYKRCFRLIADHELYFAVTVDDEGTALLDGVNALGGSRPPARSRYSMVYSIFAARRGAFRGQSEQARFEPLFADEDEQRGERCSESDQHEVADGCDSGDWPLLSTPLAPSFDLWGWKDFCRLPADGTAMLLDSPVGTVRPSRN